jgi:hypothetical protein
LSLACVQIARPAASFASVPPCAPPAWIRSHLLWRQGTFTGRGFFAFRTGPPKGPFLGQGFVASVGRPIRFGVRGAFLGRGSGLGSRLPPPRLSFTSSPQLGPCEGALQTRGGLGDGLGSLGWGAFLPESGLPPPRLSFTSPPQLGPREGGPANAGGDWGTVWEVWGGVPFPPFFWPGGGSRFGSAVLLARLGPVRGGVVNPLRLAQAKARASAPPRRDFFLPFARQAG